MLAHCVLKLQLVASCVCVCVRMCVAVCAVCVFPSPGERANNTLYVHICRVAADSRTGTTHPCCRWRTCSLPWRQDVQHQQAAGPAQHRQSLSSSSSSKSRVYSLRHGLQQETSTGLHSCCPLQPHCFQRCLLATPSCSLPT